MKKLAEYQNYHLVVDDDGKNLRILDNITKKVIVDLKADYTGYFAGIGYVYFLGTPSGETLIFAFEDAKNRRNVFQKIDFGSLVSDVDGSKNNLFGLNLKDGRLVVYDFESNFVIKDYGKSSDSISFNNLYSTGANVDGSLNLCDYKNLMTFGASLNSVYSIYDSENRMIVEDSVERIIRFDKNCENNGKQYVSFRRTSEPNTIIVKDLFAKKDVFSLRIKDAFKNTFNFKAEEIFGETFYLLSQKGKFSGIFFSYIFDENFDKVNPPNSFVKLIIQKDFFVLSNKTTSAAEFFNTDHSIICEIKFKNAYMTGIDWSDEDYIKVIVAYNFGNVKYELYDRNTLKKVEGVHAITGEVQLAKNAFFDNDGNLKFKVLSVNTDTPKNISKGQDLSFYEWLSNFGGINGFEYLLQYYLVKFEDLKMMVEAYRDDKNIHRFFQDNPRNMIKMIVENQPLSKSEIKELSSIVDVSRIKNTFSEKKMRAGFIKSNTNEVLKERFIKSGNTEKLFEVKELFLPWT